MSPRLKLQHIHLPPLTPYAVATRLQDHLRRRLLDAKDTPTSSSSSTTSSSASPSAYAATLISFTPPPTYTLGRRQVSPLSQADVARLTCPLSTPLGVFSPELISSPRGGLTTYHGPGQVVLWPVLDIHSPLHERFTVRTYTCLLEKTTIAVLRDSYGVAGFRTDDPGVWVRGDRREGREEEEEEEEKGRVRKIAAVGVHLRRHVTGLGTAVNVDFPVMGQQQQQQQQQQDGYPEEASSSGERSNPWERFVPCGLEGREVTSIMREVEGLPAGAAEGLKLERNKAWGVDEREKALADAWAEEFARRIGVEGVADITGVTG